jgi:hypothetical protein
VSITFSVASEVCSEVITDEEWLWQMLLNLLTNACKYTDKGSIHVAISVSSEVALPAASSESTIGDIKNVAPRPEALLFEVMDTGSLLLSLFKPTTSQQFLPSFCHNSRRCRHPCYQNRPHVRGL